MSTNASPPSRNFWPIGLVVAFGVFIAGTVGLVVLSARTPSELVSADYYDRELRYQDDIDRRARTQALKGQVRVAYDADRRQLTLALPAVHAARRAEGEIHLYRPSAAGLDRRVTLEVDSRGQQTLDAATLSDGLWRVRVTWRVGGEDFSCDEKVIIGVPKST
jgi:nitrogen fixation protein FixH